MLAAQPATLLVAAHDLSFAERLCHRHLLLERDALTDHGPDVAEARRRWGMPGLKAAPGDTSP